MSEEGQVVSHVTKKTSTTHPDGRTGSGTITPSGIVTPPATPGGVTRGRKPDDTDPVNMGPVKSSGNDNTPPSKKGSDEEKEFSDKRTEPKGTDDLKSGLKPKKSKSKKKKVSSKKLTGKSSNRIDSSTESEDDDDDVDDDDEFLKPEEKTITMTLRGDPDFKDVSLTENPKMPPKDPSRKRKRPAGEVEIWGNAGDWKPLVFTNKNIRQNPAKTLEITKGYQDGRKKVIGRSIAIQTDLWKSRVQGRPRKLSPNRFNRKAWDDTPLAKITFQRPLMTPDNSVTSPPVGEKEGGSRRFRPGALALAEIRHFMGMQGNDVEKYSAVSDSEFNFLILHTVMKRVILEIGSERLHDCAFEGLAYKILHYSREHYLTRVYQDTSMIATHARCTFVTDKRYACCMKNVW